MRADGDTVWGRAAPWAVTVGAALSATLVLDATRRVGAPLLLQALFAGWLVAPLIDERALGATFTSWKRRRRSR